MPAKYNIQAGTVVDSAGAINMTVVFVKSDGTRSAGVALVVPSKDHEVVHQYLSAIAQSFDATGVTTGRPVFRIVLSTGTDIVAYAPTVP